MKNPAGCVGVLHCVENSARYLGEEVAIAELNLAYR